jgi:hypothetical protein
MRGGGTQPQTPQNLTNFGLVGRETGDRWETKACKRKVKQQFDQRSLPNQTAFYGMHFGGGVLAVHCTLFFSHSRLNWSELT